ncbi:DNA mismatch repair protein MutS [bacterium]|nr:DNA mismatch repair protein MutS [bacterium]
MSELKLNDLIKAGVKLTPMMKQYVEIKSSFEDCFLLFRMGDFYEVFFEDARTASRLLNIALTHRGKLGDFKIPMAGIPHHSAANYIDRLTSQGIKVAICEQITKPGDSPGIVKRAVTQIASPGIPFDLEKLDKKDRHFIASSFFFDDNYYLVAIDFTTGDFFGHKFESKEDFLQKILHYSPKEWISYMGQYDDEDPVFQVLESCQSLKTFLSHEYFDPKLSVHLAKNEIDKVIPNFEHDHRINEDKNILIAIAAISHYIFSTQEDLELCHIKPLQILNDTSFLKVTTSTLKGLEILPKSRERYKESLLGFCDRTMTSMGGRKLKDLFTMPLLNLEKIKFRQGLIEKYLSNAQTLEAIREKLRDVRDLDRILSKISTKKAIGGDLLNLSQAIKIYGNIDSEHIQISQKFQNDFSPKDSALLSEIQESISKTINDEIGASLEKGNLIKLGADPKRDKLYKLKFSADKELEKLEQEFRDQTGIPKLRVKRNNIAGFFIEVSKSYSKKVPKHFERRQTLVNAERFSCPELEKFETKINSAKIKLEKIEREIFNSIITKITQNAALISMLSSKIALIDCLCSLSWLAYQEEFSKPKFVKNKKIFNANQMWHPLIKKNIKSDFVPHNLNLDKEKFFGLITGPNMAGKTTVMREMAIAQLLAQVGSYVPASSLEIGLCDQIFSRLGANDDILHGQSTFMVEMSETSEILRHASARSMIILDEVGRGTSTYDGLSIAWSLVEYLISKTKAITLFATHYHELIELADKETTIKNLTVETQNNNGSINFLYNLIEEPASQSFGIYVASLAGLPREVLERASSILSDLENKKEETSISQTKHFDETQLSFFEDSKQNAQIINKELEQIKQKFRSINLDTLTPLDALNKLHRLKQEISLH